MMLISSPLLNLIELEITLLPEIEEVGWFCLKGQTLKMLHEDWITRNVADVVCMFARQVDELIQSLSSAKDILSPFI
ncbi:hypothetical protein E1A91_D01G106000v1 [Gossypium mustelinum]|uniref:Uncharacterized protein n=1 Tax=Gossypium mustelinum TaxID=34275 RepID=A0A5D2W5L0_GOSMU|nr:hypothetical protein E1A91_D01G106000v1 [Gossypium mustelinum]